MAVFSTLANTQPPRKAHQINERALLLYLQQHVSNLPGDVFPGDVGASLTVRQFDHGQSNPTYILEARSGDRCGVQRYVLRKKPPGKLLRSAHAVEREYKVLKALAATPVPVPTVVCLCEDPSIIGTPFFVMNHVNGRVFTDPSLPEVSPAERTAMYAEMVRVLALIHSVDVEAVGLSSFGTKDNYSTRQVRRWASQYSASVNASEGDPSVLRLIRWLEAHIPADDASGDGAFNGLVHGDFRLDNLVFHPTEPLVVAVLDWELSTLGHHLSDLAYCCMPYHLPPGYPYLPTIARGPASTAAADPTPFSLPPGIPTQSELLSLYSRARGTPPPSPSTFTFYLALSLFRAAAIFAGVYHRALQGNASARDAIEAGAIVGVLARLALTLVGNGVPSSRLPMAASLAPTSYGSVGMAGLALGGGNNVTRTACSSGGAEGQGRQCGVGGGAGTAEDCAGGCGRGFEPSARAMDLKRRVTAFMEKHVLPNETVLYAHATSLQRWTIHPLQEELKRLAQAEGLWNLWIPAELGQRIASVLVPAGGNREGEQALLCGVGLSNLDYAHVCEVMGRSVWAPEVFNCSAPDTGNMEVLARYGSPQQQRHWLLPLLKGEIRSCFAMTEPAVASSDATNITASIKRDDAGDHYILNGRKWWTSGALDPRCQVAIFMGKTDPSASLHRQQSMVLADMRDCGVRVLRPLLVMGYDDAPHGHAEVVFDNVRVPLENMLLGEGRGFEIAQGRLGPGRLHHCMRLIGAAERGIELMVQRASERKAFGSKLARLGSVRAEIAMSRILLDQARLLVLNAAHQLDLQGNRKARKAIAMAKVATPLAAQKILDSAMQIHGAAGLSSDLPLAHLWTAARSLRIADGPDEVHLETIGRLEIGKARL